MNNYSTMKRFGVTAIALALSACSSSNEVVFNTGSSSTGGGSDNNNDGLVYKKDSIPGDALTVTGSYVERNGEGGEIGAITDTSHGIAGDQAALTDTYSIALDDGTTYTPLYSYQVNLLEEAVAAGDDFYVLDRLSYYGLIKYFGVNLGSALWGLSYGTSSSVGGNGYLEMAFAQGFATDASVMSALTGTATYQGRAVISGAGFDVAQATSVEADSTFSVDFGNKTLTGTISPSANSTTSFDDISLAASITGNAFSGEKDGTTTSGQFYGTNGNELAGTFENTGKDLLGAYGAIRAQEDDGSSDETEPETETPVVEVNYVSGALRTVASNGIVDGAQTGISTYTTTELGRSTTSVNGATSYTGTTGSFDTNGNAQTLTLTLIDLASILRDSTKSKKLTLIDAAGYIYSPTYWSEVRLGTAMYGLNLSYGEWYTTSSYAWAVGDITPDDAVPTTGTATYYGAAGISSRPLNTASNAVAATAEFSVDFGNKSLSGTITPIQSTAYTTIGGTVDTINLGARIDGATFIGTKDGIVTQGYFLGPNAEEITGIFHTTTDVLADHIHGAFGAVKQ